MLKYCETTTLILIWVFALSVGWAFGAYLVTSRQQERARGRQPRAPSSAGIGAGFIAPALVAAPVVLVLAFRLVGVNLLYPVHLFADLATLVAAAIAPAGVLLVSSGLVGALTRQISQEYERWEPKTFVLMARALGRRPGRTLRRLVLLKAILGAWSQCLPWLFGELVIVETVFNAPGLGLDAWHLARARDFGGLATTIAWLAGLYAICVFAAAVVSRRLGRRLESYA